MEMKKAYSSKTPEPDTLSIREFRKMGTLRPSIVQNFGKEKHRFTEDEEKAIKKQFKTFAVDGAITREGFAKFMGVLAADNNTYLADRIFTIVDQDGDEKVRKLTEDGSEGVHGAT